MNGNSTHGNSKPITHEEIELTLLRFQASGGLITKLPDQEASRGAVVGSKEWHGIFVQRIRASKMELCQHEKRKRRDPCRRMAACGTKADLAIDHYLGCDHPQHTAGSVLLCVTEPH
ncbi:MAG: hypothetical protein IIA40_08110 [SAR324 cluster bacterium]|nr:hypothetical protein [SAR324 cluster bacterium]